MELCQLQAGSPTSHNQSLYQAPVASSTYPSSETSLVSSRKEFLQACVKACVLAPADYDLISRITPAAVGSPLYDSITNLYVAELALAGILFKQDPKHVREILERWDINFALLLGITPGETEFLSFIERETQFFHELRQLHSPETLEETSRFLENQKPYCFEMLAGLGQLFAEHTATELIQCMTESPWDITSCAFFMGHARKLDSLMDHIGTAVKNGILGKSREAAVRCFSNLTTTQEYRDSVCKRIEKIWQSNESLFLLPDCKLTLGRRLLSDPTNDIVWEAIQEELAVGMIDHALTCIQNRNHSVAARFCEGLPKSIKKELPPTLTQEGLLHLLTDGPLRPEIDLRAFCNPELKCLFFTIKNGDRQIVGYLFGSYHFLPEDSVKLPLHVRKAFQEATLFMPEQDMFLEKTLSEALTKMTTLTMAWSNVAQTKVSLIDYEYMLASKQLGKRVVSLEGESMQTALTLMEKYKVPQAESVASLVRNLSKCARIIMSGDLALAEQRFQEENIMNPEDSTYVVKERSEIQARALNKTLRDTPTEIPFAMVGADHLTDIIPYLRSQGWIVDQQFS